MKAPLAILLCDACGQPIRRVDDAWVEWTIDIRERPAVCDSLRIVHHALASPRPGPYRCYRRAVACYQGPDLNGVGEPLPPDVRIQDHHLRAIHAGVDRWMDRTWRDPSMARHRIMNAVLVLGVTPEDVDE